MKDRTTQYRELATELGCGALVLIGEPAIQHAVGLSLYTQRLIPDRPVVLVVPRQGAPVVVCCVLEVDQISAALPELDIRSFPEFGADPWKLVAEIADLEGLAVGVEQLMPVAWVDSLRRHLGSERIRVLGGEIARLRAIKDGEERRLFEEASQAADVAIAYGADLVKPGSSEMEIAERIVACFREQLPGRTSEVSAMAITPKNNRSMHHLPGADLMPTTGPVRLGIVGRVDGYWIIITRMLLLGTQPEFEAAYRRYVEVYEGGLADLTPGARAGDLYQRCAERAAAHGFELTTLKTAHGTGLEFRELPIVMPGSDEVLEPGMVLAYDYGLETEEGLVLHLEDRVEITEDGPRRISGGWQLSDLRGGHRGLL